MPEDEQISFRVHSCSVRAQKGVLYRHDLFNCELVRLTASIGWLTAVSHEKVPTAGCSKP